MLHKQCLKTPNLFPFFLFPPSFWLALSLTLVLLGLQTSAHILMFIFQPILKGQVVKFWPCVDEGIKGLCTCQFRLETPFAPFRK